MNDSPVDCQNVKLPQATFVTRAAARPTKTLLVKKVVAPWRVGFVLVGECLGAPEKAKKEIVKFAVTIVVKLLQKDNKTPKNHRIA